MGESYLSLVEKVRIMALLNLIFNLPKDERIIPFANISQVTCLPIENVEGILMKALSKELIKGKIDQLNQCMQITWLIPRVLNNDRIGVMKQKIEDFEKRSGEVFAQVEMISNSGI